MCVWARIEILILKYFKIFDEKKYIDRSSNKLRLIYKKNDGTENINGRKNELSITFVKGKTLVYCIVSYA